MTFNSIDEIKNHILSRCSSAIKKAQEEAYDIIAKFLFQYYEEFTPALYERTYQLLCSLVKTGIKSTGNGYIAEIYFDIGMLDYSTKTLKGITYPNKGWSEQATLDSAMVGGTHGGYVAPNNTQVWTESLAVLDANMINILKRSLISAGIPIK